MPERAELPGLYYRDGLVVLARVREAPAWMSWDDRAEAWVAPGRRLPEMREWAQKHGIPDTSGGGESLDAWSAADGRGSVVLPTGSGKTFVAILAIDHVRRGACVVAPTRALVAQWYGQLADAFGADRIGAYYADEKVVRPITVTTYHSAFNLLEQAGDRFELLVLDSGSHGHVSGWQRPGAAPARRARRVPPRPGGGTSCLSSTGAWPPEKRETRSGPGSSAQRSAPSSGSRNGHVSDR